MKNIAPDIIRQRLLMEGYFTADVNRETLEQYLPGIAQHLGLRTYGSPIIFSPSGEGKEENQGFDAFIPLIDSGISAYVWSKQRFFSVIIYTCKKFDEAAALHYTAEVFSIDGEMVHCAF